MTSMARAAALALEVERVELLGTITAAGGTTIAELDFGGMRPTTSSGDTFAGLASCVAPATTTVHGVGARFTNTGRSVTVAAAALRSSDARGAALVGASF